MTATRTKDKDGMSEKSDFRLTPSAPPRTLDEVEKSHIQATIVWAGGNKSKAARVLGIDRRTLFRKLAKYKGKV